MAQEPCFFHPRQTITSSSVELSLHLTRLFFSFLANSCCIIVGGITFLYVIVTLTPVCFVSWFDIISVE